MTRLMRQKYTCAHCGKDSTAETAFSRWTRANPDLDSSYGICIIDQDYWVHRFKSHKGRDFQLLMGVEVKTHSSEPSPAQKDTLLAVNQVMRNRRQTPTKENKFQSGNAATQIASFMLNRRVWLRTFGMHLLTFSGHGPDDSVVITWDKTRITKEILTKIIKFDLDPDTLNELDLRSHHKPLDLPFLFGMTEFGRNKQ
jgi:hypothetical protein